MQNQTQTSFISRMILIFSGILLGLLASSAVLANSGVNTNRNPVADFDGDGKSDISVFRPSNGFWYYIKSSDGTFSSSFNSVQFGTSGDKPVPADYDGDGKTDIAVFRPSIGVWYLLQSTEGFTAQQFGFGDDVPIPNVFVR